MDWNSKRGLEPCPHTWRLIHNLKPTKNLCPYCTFEAGRESAIQDAQDALRTNP